MSLLMEFRSKMEYCDVILTVNPNYGESGEVVHRHSLGTSARTMQQIYF